MRKVINDLIEYQQEILLKAAKALVPTVTLDDLLQPNDFPELEKDPYFRYEEGVLAGILTAQAALAASWKREISES